MDDVMKSDSRREKMLPLEPASRFKRWIAHSIDLFLVSIIVRVSFPFLGKNILSKLVFRLFVEGKRLRELNLEPAVLFISVVLLVYTMIVYALCNSALMRRRGQTVGKWLFNIRVVNLDGTLPSVYTGIWKRELCFSCIFPLIAGVLLWQLVSLDAAKLVVGLYSLIDALSIFSEGGRCLHDRFAKTMVCRMPSVEPPGGLQGERDAAAGV